MLSNDPDGFDIRDPSAKRASRRKGHLKGSGVFQEIHCDGHEKLSSKALQLGSVGIEIYGMKCHSSGLVIFEQVVPNSRCEITIAHCYLDMVEEYGGKLNTFCVIFMIFIYPFQKYLYRLLLMVVMRLVKCVLVTLHCGKSYYIYVFML